MDELEEIDYIDFAVNQTNWSRSPKETLTTQQIIISIFSIAAIIPNAILIYMVVRNALYKLNFHFTILHWSIANVIIIVSALYFSILPEIYRSYGLVYILFFANALSIFIPLFFATLFVFDKFINSKKKCRYSIYTIWAIITAIVVVYAICVCFYFPEIELYLIGAFYILEIPCFFILIIKLIIYCIQPSDEDNYKLRLMLSSVYIVTTISRLFISFLSTVHFFKLLPIYEIRMVLVYSNGLINLILLLLFDDQINTHFFKLCGRNSHHPNVQYSSTTSDEADKDTSKSQEV